MEIPDEIEKITSSRKKKASTTPSAVSEVPGKKPSSVWRIIRRVAGWVMIAIVAIGAVTLILVFHKAAAPVVHTDQAAARRLEAKLRQAEAAAATGAPPVLRLDEGELNSILDSHLALNRAAPARNAAGSVRDVKINLIDDRLHVYVLLDFHGKDLTFHLEGKLHASGGYIEFEPVGGKIGALPIPRSALERAVREMMDSPEGREEMRMPTYLRDLKVEGGKLVAVFK